MHAAEAWFQDPYGGHGSYRSLSGATLVHEAPVVSAKVQATVLAGGKAYCLADVEGQGHSAYVVGGATSLLHGLAAATPGRITLVHSTSADAASLCAAIS
jgi:hypothetical protein